jgi:hypothetical protein
MCLRYAFLLLLVLFNLRRWLIIAVQLIVETVKPTDLT